MLAGKLSDEEMSKFDDLMKVIAEAAKRHEESELAGEDEEDDARKLNNAAANQEKEEGKMKAAMDAAIDRAVSARVNAEIGRAVSVATKKLQDNFAAVHDAEREVEPYVGKLAMSFDSAEAVRRAALDVIGVDHAGVHPSALSAILKAQPLPGQANLMPRRDAKSARDAEAALAAILPGLEPVRVL
jgi:hypothetical protein